MSERGDALRVPEALDREFNDLHLQAYAAGCAELAWKLAEFSEGEHGVNKAVLLPSRGAIPPFVGAAIVSKVDKDFDGFDLSQSIETPPLDCFEPIRKLNPKDNLPENPVRTLVFPLTADVNMDQLTEGNHEKSDKIVEDVRRFCVRVIAEFFKEPQKRDGKEFNTFLNFLEVVEGRKGLVDFYRSFPRIDKMFMVDTVISGRASWTILDEFSKLGVKLGDQLIPVLIVDHQGELLKKEYRKYLDQFRENLVILPRILTEDRGAALAGIVAVMYPDLIAGSKGKMGCGDIHITCGSWHNLPKKEKATYGHVYNSFINLLTAIFEGDDNETFERKRRFFLNELSGERFLERRRSMKQSDISEYVNPNLHIRGVEETSSHVIQIRLKEKDTQDLLKKICSQGK